MPACEPSQICRHSRHRLPVNGPAANDFPQLVPDEARVIATDESAEYFFREGCHILELWNDPDDREVSIARARVEPGIVTLVHRLADTTERYVILEGRGIFRSNNIEQDVTAGNVVVIPPGCNQSIENNGEQDLVFLAICSPRFVENNYSDKPVT